MTSKASRLSRKFKIGAFAVIAGATIVITGTNVLAGLNATVSASQTNTSGTLVLGKSDNGVGFTTSISNLAPGDVVNRYVNLTNSGTLDAQGLGLAITSTGTANLITDGVSPSTTRALTVAIFSCAGGTWNASTGVCSGTERTEISATTLTRHHHIYQSLLVIQINRQRTKLRQIRQPQIKRQQKKQPQTKQPQTKRQRTKLRQIRQRQKKPPLI